MAIEQKLLDFQELAANFAKRYAFVEWKQEAIKYDDLNLVPWLERVRQSTSDLEFFEICAQYLSYAQSILVRKREIDTAGEFPRSVYIENIGVRPDIEDDYMVVNNVLFNGKPFVENCARAMLRLISPEQPDTADVAGR